VPSQGLFKGFGRIIPGKSTETRVDPAINTKELSRVPGAGIASRLDPWWWLVAVVALIIILLMVFQPDPYWNMVLFVGDGLAITVFLTVVSFFFIIILGIIGGMARIAKNPVIHFFATLYVEIFRGIPLLVQLIWWYFAAPAVIKTIGQLLNFAAMADYQSNALVLAIAGLVICYGAYMSEIFRAGIQSIPKGQIEAARSQGMTYLQAMRYVVLPQAIRVVMPPVGNEFIMLIKDSSLVSVVAVADLTRRGREFMATHFNPIETWTMIALLYLVLTLFFSRLIDWLEKRRRYER
jgi:polar amino acid transport system permease protein